jgi:hypothetical protein
VGRNEFYVPSDPFDARIDGGAWGTRCLKVAPRDNRRGRIFYEPLDSLAYGVSDTGKFQCRYPTSVGLDLGQP